MGGRPAIWERKLEQRRRKTLEEARGRAGRQGYGRRGRRIGSLTGDRSAGWGHLLPPIIRSSAGDGSVWWHTLIFHFHFCSTCCLGVRHKKKKKMPKKERKRGKKGWQAHCFHHSGVVVLPNLLFCLSPASRQRRQSFFPPLPIDCELAGLLLETLFPNVNSR